MKTCGNCGSPSMRYYVCFECGWIDPKTKKKDEKIKLRIEKERKIKKKVSMEKPRVGRGYLGYSGVLAKR